MRMPLAKPEVKLCLLLMDVTGHVGERQDSGGAKLGDDCEKAVREVLLGQVLDMDLVCPAVYVYHKVSKS